MSEKHCNYCNQPLTRRPDEGAADFRKRRTCGRHCAGELMRLARLAPSDPKRCVVCGARFERRDDESIKRFRERLTCSKQCKSERVAQMGAARKVALPSKQCHLCGKQFGRRPGEMAGDYRKRITCSSECHRDFQARARMVLGPERSSQYPPEFNDALRASVRARDGESCRSCGKTQGQRKLSVHHIDFDKSNSDPANLITLCESCHKLVHKRDIRLDLSLTNLQEII